MRLFSINFTNFVRRIFIHNLKDKKTVKQKQKINNIKIKYNSKKLPTKELF